MYIYLTRSGAVRLAGGSSLQSGRLEVYLNGQWGSVCDTHWTDRDASVVCRQLGLGYGNLCLILFRAVNLTICRIQKTLLSATPVAIK